MNRIPWTTIVLIAVGVAASKTLSGSQETGELAIDAVFLWFLGAAAEAFLGWRLLPFVLAVSGGQALILLVLACLIVLKDVWRDLLHG